MQRSTVEEVYALIEGDLERILDNGMLPERMADADMGRADRNAAKALLARVYLYERNYDKAYEYASAVLAQNPIAAMNEYGALWTDESNKEVLFEFEKTFRRRDYRYYFL